MRARCTGAPIKLFQSKLDDWRTFLQDRVNYATGLIAGTTTQFGETQVDNAPISDFIGVIADQNNMAACSTIPLT